MLRRGQLSVAGAIVAIVGLLIPVTSAGAGGAVFSPSSDLPEGTPTDPAATTPSDTTSVVEWLASSDVDGFAVCVTDPAALHIAIEGVDSEGAHRDMDTVLWLFDADGNLVAWNDDRSAADLSSELVAGSAAETTPGVHVVAFAPFRSTPLDPAGANIELPGSGPVTSWRYGSSPDPGLVQVDLLAGAMGSQDCGGGTSAGGSTSAGVTTGNGRCQQLGGPAADNDHAKGLDVAADHRHRAAC